MKPEDKQVLYLILLEIFVWASIIALLFLFNLVLIPWGLNATGLEKIRIDLIRFSIAGLSLVIWLGSWYYLMKLILRAGLKNRQPT